MEAGNNSKRLQELYDGLIKDNYDLNSIGRNIDEFAEKLATDTVFSNFVYDDLRGKTGFSGSKADFLVKALGSRVVPSSISKGRKTVPPYKPNKNEYVHFETPIKNVLGGGEKTAEDYAIDALEATGRATPMTGADKYRFQKNNVINSIGAEKVIEEAKTRKINKPQVDLSVVGKSILPDDIKKQEEQKQLQAIETAKQNIEEEKAQRQMIDKTIGNVRERAQKEYNEYAEQLRKREEAIPYFVRGDKDVYVSPINAELANSVPAATLQVIDDTEKLLNAPRKGSNWANSMWAGAKDAADAESFFTFGLSNIAKSATIKSVVDKYAAGGHLSKSEEDLMEALATNTLVAYLRKDDVSGWYTAGQIAEASAEIATQFLGTNVIGTAATKAISKGIGKFLSKNTPKLVAKMAIKGLGGATLRGARFVGKGALDTFVGGTAQSIFMPNTYSNLLQKKTGTVSFDKDKGEYDVEPAQLSNIQALASASIETISERAGGAFAGFGGKVFKNIIPKGWAKLSSKGIVGNIVKLGGTANEYLAKAGVNGQFGEMSEEVFGQTLDRIIGASSDEEWNSFWSKDNFLQMAGGFAPMSLVGLGGNAVTFAKSSLDTYRAEKSFLNFLRQQGIKDSRKIIKDIKDTPIERLQGTLHQYTQEIGGYTGDKLNEIGVEFNREAANVIVNNMRRDIYASSEEKSVSTDERQEVTEENENKTTPQGIADVAEGNIPQLQQGDEVEYDNTQWIVGDVAEEDGEYTLGDESIPLKKGNVLMFEIDGDGVQILDSAADLYPEQQQNIDNDTESGRQEIYEKYRPVVNVDTGNITQLSNVAGTDNIAYVVKGKVVYDEDGNIDYDKSDDTIYYKVYDKDGNEVDGGTPKPIYLKTRRTEFGKVLSDVPIEEYVDNELYPQEQNNIRQATNNGQTNIEQSTPAESVTPNEYQEVTEENDSTEFDENGGYSNIQNTVLSDEEADLLMSAMEQNAEAMPAIELTPDNWVAEFGQNGTVSTPIGDVKMGDNQLAKLFLKKRTREFGMIKPTLVNPDVIIEKTSVADNAERNTKLLFVKTFKDENGQKHVHFENVTVQKGGLEVSISSHIVDKSAIRKELANGIVIYNKPELTSIGSDVYLTETHEGQSDLVPTQKANSDLQYKGTTNNLNEQEEFYNSLPRNKKGEIDESQMSAEQKIGYAQAEFGQRTDLVRDYVAEQSKALSEKIAKLTNKTGKSVAEYKELAAMQEDKNVFVEYLNEQRQQQEQATPRRTVEEAAAEREERRAAEKEQREQAIREKEERDGVPDFMQDTPEDARLRGFRLRTGERIDRQEPIETGKYNTARRKFTNDTGAVEGGRPEADIAEVGESRDVLYMTTDEINDRFNEELQQQIDGTLPKGHVYSLGIPNDILRSAGLPNLPIEMSAEMLKNKSSAKYRQHHPFDISSIKDLPRAIQNPIAVFNNPNNDGKVLLTELQYNGVNHIVAIKVRSERKSNNIEIDVNSVSTIFPKDRIEKIVEWLLDKENQGRKAYLNKEKVLTWLSDNETITRSKGYNTKDIAKVIKDFENPTLSEEKNEETRLKVSKRKARGATTEKLEELVTLLKKTGFGDVKTGEDFYNALAEIEDKEGSRFMIGKQARATYEAQIRKKNPNITQEDLKTSLDFLHSLEDNKENAKAIKVAVKWLADDTIRLPYAIDNVRKAIAVAEKNKVDPTQYSSPMDIIDEFYKDVEYGSHIDPDRVEAFKNKRVVGKGKNKVAIYDIDDNRQGQEAVCKICHEHFGYSVENKDSKQPWCLASFTRKGKPTESAIKYWDKTYNSVGKKIAFKDGKPIAFMAHDRGHDYDLWWNLRDEPSDNLPLPNGRYISPEGEIELRKYGEGEDELFDEAVEYVADELSDSDVERILGDLKEKIDDGVEDVGISYLFDDAEERAYEKARRSFIETTRYDIDSGDYDKYLKEYIDRYKEKYHIGEDEEIDEDDLDDLKDELAEDIADNFEDYDGASIWNDIFQEKYEDELYNEDYSLSQKIDMIEDHIRQYPMGSVADDVSDKEIELRGDDLEVDELGGSYRYSRPNGTVLGFVKGNTIYLNPDEVSLNTPIHEFGHLWVSQVKEHFPDLWAKGKELFLESDYLRKVQADPNYRHLDLDGQIDEAMARAIGDRGEQELDKTLLEKILDWIAEVWDKIGGVFGIDNLTSEQISNLTLQDFTDMATSELLSGQNLTERVNGNRGGATRYNTADETADIKARAIADGTFMKAPNGKDTNLTERQWLQVRTKAFKRWFGDWENAYKLELIENLQPIGVDNKGLSRERAEEEYKKIGTSKTNRYDNRRIEFVNNAFGKIARHKNSALILDIIPQLNDLFESAIPIYFEEEREPLKSTNIVGSHNYLGKVRVNDEDYYVRITAQELTPSWKQNEKQGKSNFHNMAVSDIAIYDESGSSVTAKDYSIDNDNRNRFVDAKLQHFFETAREARENSSKVVDENGEPMVVYHGTDTRASFNKFKGAVHFFTENKDIAGDFGVDASMDKVRKGRDFSEYADEKGYLGYKIYETFLSLQNPFIVDADNSEWDEIKTPKEMGGKGAKTTDQIGRWAKRNGYGGVVIKNTIDANSHIPISQYIAFNPTQIKSATDNIGTFDGEDGDIRYMLVNVQDEKAIDEERRRPKFEIKGEDVYTTMYTTRADTETEIDVLYNGNDFEKALSKAEGYNEDSDREDLTVGVEAVRLKIPIAAIKEEYDYDDEEYDGDVAPFVEDYIDDFVENVDYDRYETGRDMFDVYKSKLAPDERDLIEAVVDELWRQTGFSVGKYSTFYITKNGEMTDEEADKDGELNAFVSMRIADHTHNRHNGDSTLNIVIADDDPTKTKFQSSKEDLRYTTKDNAEEIVKDILDFWRQYAREYFGDINKQFNDDLDEFERNRLLSSRKFNLGRPSPILMSAGLNGVSIQMTQSVLRKHLDKHNLKTDDLRELPEAIRTPIMVYEWGDKARNSVIVTSIPRGEERITTTIRLTRDGNKLNVNEISSIYGKSAERLIRDINTPKSEFGKDNLRYVDKKQVLDWFAMEAPKASSQTQQELITATKVIENFENPPINEKKVIDDTTSDMVRYSIRANDQLDREDEIMGKKATEIYEARVKMGKQMNQSNPNLMPNKKIFDEINEKTENRRAKIAEHAVDCYLPMKHFIEVLNKHGYNISDYNNWYMNVFGLGGKNEAEYEKYQAERSIPLQRAAKAAMDSGNITYRDLENYLILKHGQERNKYYKERDEKLGVKPMKDYSGTEAVMFEEFCKRTGIEVKTIKESIPKLVDGDPNTIQYGKGDSEFSKDGKKIPDSEVNERFELWRKQHTPEDIIKDYEGKIGKEKVEDLWAKIRKATQFTLDCQKKGGLTSEAMYEKASGMWKFFVPLRGFDMGTAQDKFDYDLNSITLFTDFKVKETLGRTRRSVSPLAWTEQMAHISIQQKNKNLLNQSLRRLASVSMARKDNIMFLSKQYKEPDVIENGKVVKKGALIYPPAYTGDLSVDGAAFERWDAAIKEGVKDGTIEVVEHSNVNFGMIVSPDKVKQHIVRVYEGGKPVDVIFNTSPSVPRAINGLNHKTAISNHWIYKNLKEGTRMMAQTMTTLNPAFVGKNFSRDYLFANTMLFGREDMSYVVNFNKNITKATPVLLNYVKGKSLLGWAAGDKGNIQDNEYGKWLTEFVMNGGKTGFSQMLKFEKMSNDVKKQTEKGDKKVHYGVNDYIHFIEALNDYAENITRVSAYCASRQAGRSIERSISDAKELTINFNRKGTDGGIWGAVRSLCAFSNASMQALVVFSRGVRANPKRMSALISGYTAMAITMAVIAKTINGDDDKNDYFRLSKFDRQNNLCLPMFGGGFLKIPLPQEMRVFYKLGDEIALCLFGNEPPEVAAQEVFMGALDLLPSFAAGATSISDVLDEKIGAGELLLAHQPITIIQPATQLMTNRNFLNYRIYDDNKWGGRRKELPEYRKALRNKGGETYSPNFVVKLSEGISRLTGGSDLKRGVVEVNPDVINHLMRGYFGGLYSSAVAAINMGDKGAQSIAAGEMKMKTTDSPTMKAFYVSPSNLRYTDDILNAQYMSILKEAKKHADVYANYLKEGEVDRFEKETKMTEDEALDWRYLVKGIDKEVQELRNEIATAETTEERDEALRQLEALQREAIEMAAKLKK